MELIALVSIYKFQVGKFYYTYIKCDLPQMYILYICKWIPHSLNVAESELSEVEWYYYMFKPDFKKKKFQNACISL